MTKTSIVLAFDLYGTLLSTESIAQELAAHFEQDKARSIAAVWRKYQLEYTWRLNSMKQYQHFSEVTRNSLHHALAEHGVSLSAEASDTLMEAYDRLSTFPDVKPALQELAGNGNTQSVIFSNGTSTMVSSSVEKSAELRAFAFKDIVTVDNVSAFKPAPEVYHYLAHKLGRTGQESSLWLVSGNPFDVCGARAVGMQAIWVDRAGNGWQDRLGPQPTVIVRSLEEIPGIAERQVAGTTT